MKTSCQTHHLLPSSSHSLAAGSSTSMITETSEPWLPRAFGGRSSSDGPFLEGLALLWLYISPHF